MNADSMAIVEPYANSDTEVRHVIPKVTIRKMPAIYLENIKKKPFRAIALKDFVYGLTVPGKSPGTVSGSRYA